MTALLLQLAALAAISVLPAYLARKKGRNFAGWYLYAFFIWILAMIHVLFLKPRQAPGRPEAAPSALSWLTETPTLPS